MTKSWEIENDFRYILDEGDRCLNHLNNKHILLTGCTGFIGKWLILTLLTFIKNNQKIDIYLDIVTRNKKKLLANSIIDFNYPFINIIETDIRKITLNKSYDYVVHGATSASAQLNENNPVEMFSVIIDGTKRLLEELVKQKFSGKVMNLSSGAVYGLQSKIKNVKELDMTGPDIINPINAYAEAKRASESLFSLFKKQHNIKFVNARIFALLGPLLPLDIHFAAGNFINCAINGNKILINGDGTPIRSYLYPTDLILWILFLMSNKDSEGAYNLGSDEAISIEELAKLISNKYNVSYSVANEIDKGWNISRYVPCNKKIIKFTNIKQSVPLEDAINRTFLWGKNNEES